MEPIDKLNRSYQNKINNYRNKLTVLQQKHNELKEYHSNHVRLINQLYNSGKIDLDTLKAYGVGLKKNKNLPKITNHIIYNED